MNGRGLLIVLNGSKLKEIYVDDTVVVLKNYALPVADNQMSFREMLREMSVMIYKVDGGLMTKKCLSEYLRTQDFGTSTQKDFYLEKYISSITNAAFVAKAASNDAIVASMANESNADVSTTAATTVVTASVPLAQTTAPQSAKTTSVAAATTIPLPK